MKRLLTIMFTALALTGAVRAQTLAFNLTGSVEKISKGCHPKATHRIKCTQVELFSSAVDLTKHEGKLVYLEGRYQVRLGCVATLEVDKVEGAKAYTSAFAFGGYRRGNTIIFTTRAPAGFVVMMLSAGPGFLPVPISGFGSLLIDFQTAVLWNTVPSIGVSVTTIRIPTDAHLIGKTAWYQTASLQLLPQIGGSLLNPGCITVR